MPSFSSGVSPWKVYGVVWEKKEGNNLWPLLLLIAAVPETSASFQTLRPLDDAESDRSSIISRSSSLPGPSVG